MILLIPHILSNTKILQNWFVIVKSNFLENHTFLDVNNKSKYIVLT